MSNRFKELLAKGPVLFDGAMGTMLYGMGIFINRSFDETNVSNPELVSRVHKAYVDAGAMVLQTNTFAANRIRLAKFGLAERLKDINVRGVELARDAAGSDVLVAGSMGPTGVVPDLYHSESMADLRDVFLEQAGVLLDKGVDLMILETFKHTSEIKLAIEAIHDLQPDMPVIALMSFGEDLRVSDGSDPAGVAGLLLDWGADVIGSNCGIGPAQVYDVMAGMAGEDRVLMAQPNAGLPRKVDSREMYMATPDYFAEYARRYLDMGVRIIGGCCGSTPEHIRRMAQALKMRSPVVKMAPNLSVKANKRDAPMNEIPLAQRSLLGKALSQGFPASVELDPPRGLNTAPMKEGVENLVREGVRFVNIADGPRASARMSPLAMALILRDTGVEPIVHVTTRDRNLLGLQADLLGMHTLGIRNLLVITGDPSKLGDYPESTTVYDLDSVGLLRMISDLNRGIEPSGRSIGSQTGFVKGCGVDPGSVNLEKEVSRLFLKIEAGADFIMTQPVFDSGTMERFLQAIDGIEIPLLIGVWPLASYRNAEFMNNEVPGVHIPDKIMQRMKLANKGPKARKEGIAIAREMIVEFRDRVNGIYVMPPFGRLDVALSVLEGFPK